MKRHAVTKGQVAAQGNVIQNAETKHRKVASEKGGKTFSALHGALLPNLTKAGFKIWNTLKDSEHFAESIKVI